MTAAVWAAVWVVLLTTTLLLLRRRSSDLYRIPSPPTWDFVMGHVYHMSHYVSNGHELFLKWHEQLGPYVRIRLLHRSIVLVADPATAVDIYGRGSNSCPQRTPEYTTFDTVHGQAGCSAIFTHQDEASWRAIRKAVAPAYAPATIRHCFDQVVSSYAALCSSIQQRLQSQHLQQQQQQQLPTQQQPQQQQQAAAAAPSPQHTAASRDPPQTSASPATTPLEVLIDEEALAATFDIFGRAFLCLPPQDMFDTRAMAHAAGEVVAIANTFVSQPWKQLYVWAPWACTWWCEEARRFLSLRCLMQRVTQRITEALQSAGPPADSDTSLAACLRRVVDPHTGRPYTKQQLQAELLMQLVGQESVPWTVAWTLFCLIQHPAVEQQVLAELVAAGVPPGDLAGASDALNKDLLRQLPLLDAVLQEAMRLYPAGVAASPRLTQKVTQVGPYKVPAGVVVFPCLYTILTYSRNWQQPLEFQPERWLPSAGPSATAAAADGAGNTPADNNQPSTDATPNTTATSSSGSSNPAFMPFGSGPKACVAQHLAAMECKVLLVLLLSMFEWRLAPRMGGPQQVLSRVVAALELRVEGGMWLCPKLRAPQSPL